MGYRLTDEEISPFVFKYKNTYGDVTIEEWDCDTRGLADAATKKARNETLKEVKAWLDSFGIKVVYDYQGRDCLDVGNRRYKPLPDDPNRFFPKEIE